MFGDVPQDSGNVDYRRREVDTSTVSLTPESLSLQGNGSTPNASVLGTVPASETAAGAAAGWQFIPLDLDSLAQIDIEFDGDFSTQARVFQTGQGVLFNNEKNISDPKVSIVLVEEATPSISDHVGDAVAEDTAQSVYKIFDLVSSGRAVDSGSHAYQVDGRVGAYVYVNKRTTDDYPTQGLLVRYFVNQFATTGGLFATSRTGTATYPNPTSVDISPITNDENKPALDITGDDPDVVSEWERVIHASYDIWDQETTPRVKSISYVDESALNEEQLTAISAVPGQKIAAFGGVLGFPRYGAFIGNRAAYAGIKGNPATVITSFANGYNDFAQDRAVLRDQDSTRSGSRFIVEQERRLDRDFSTEHIIPTGEAVTALTNFHGLVAFSEKACYLLTDGDKTAIDATNLSLDFQYQFDKGCAPGFTPLRIGEYLMIYDENDKDLAVIYPAENRIGLKYISIGQLRNDEWFKRNIVKKMVRYYGGENKQGVIFLTQENKLAFMAADLSAQTFEDFRMGIVPWDMPATADGGQAEILDISSFGDDRVFISVRRGGSIATEEFSLEAQFDADDRPEAEFANEVVLANQERNGFVPVQAETTDADAQVAEALDRDWTDTNPIIVVEKSGLAIAETDDTNGFIDGWQVAAKDDDDANIHILSLHGFNDGDDAPNADNPADSRDTATRVQTGAVYKDVRGYNRFNPLGDSWIIYGGQADSQLGWGPTATFQSEALGGTGDTEFPDGSRWIFKADVELDKRVNTSDNVEFMTIDSAAGTRFVSLVSDSGGNLKLRLPDGTLVDTTGTDGKQAQVGQRTRNGYAIILDRVDYDAPETGNQTIRFDDVAVPDLSQIAAQGAEVRFNLFKAEENDDKTARVQVEVTDEPRVGRSIVPIFATQYNMGFNLVRPGQAHETGSILLRVPSTVTGEADLQVTIPDVTRGISAPAVLPDGRRAFVTVSESGEHLSLAAVSIEIENPVATRRPRVSYTNNGVTQTTLDQAFLSEITWPDESETRDVALRGVVGALGGISYVKNYDSYDDEVASPGSFIRIVGFSQREEARLASGQEAVIFGSYRPVVPSGPAGYFANRYRAQLAVTLTEGAAEETVTVEGVMFSQPYIYSGLLTNSTQGNEVTFQTSDGNTHEFAWHTDVFAKNPVVKGKFFDVRILSVEFEYDAGQPLKPNGSGPVQTYDYNITDATFFTKTLNRVIRNVEYNPIENEQILIYKRDNSIPPGSGSLNIPITSDAIKTSDYEIYSDDDITIWANNRGGTAIKEGLRLQGIFADIRVVASTHNGLFSTALGNPSAANIITKTFGRPGRDTTTLTGGFLNDGDRYSYSVEISDGKASGFITGPLIGAEIDLDNDATNDVSVGDTEVVDPDKASDHYQVTVFQRGLQVASTRITNNNLTYSAGFPFFKFKPVLTSGGTTISHVRVINRLIAYQTPDEAANVPISELAEITLPFFRQTTWSDYITRELRFPLSFDYDTSRNFEELLPGEIFVGRMEYQVADGETSSMSDLIRSTILTLRDSGNIPGVGEDTMTVDSAFLNDRNRVVSAPGLGQDKSIIAFAVDRTTETLTRLVVAMNGEVILDEEVENSPGLRYLIRNIGVGQQPESNAYYFRKPTFAILQVEGRSEFEVSRLPLLASADVSLDEAQKASFVTRRFDYAGRIPVSVSFQLLPPWVPELGAYNDKYEQEFNRVTLKVTKLPLSNGNVMEFRGKDITPQATLNESDTFSGDISRKYRSRLTRRHKTRTTDELLGEGMRCVFVNKPDFYIEKFIAEMSISSPQN